MGNKIALWKKSEEYTDKVAMYKTKTTINETKRP